MTDLQVVGYLSVSQDDNFCRVQVNVVYFDNETGKPKNIVESEDDGLFLVDLGVKCLSKFIVEETSLKLSYPFTCQIGYFSPYCVDLQTAQKMVHTFRRILKKMEKYDNQFGPPESMGQYIVRFLTAIGAKGIIIRTTGNSWSYMENEYALFPISQTPSLIEIELRKLKNQNKINTGR